MCGRAKEDRRTPFYIDLKVPRYKEVKAKSIFWRWLLIRSGAGPPTPYTQL